MNQKNEKKRKEKGTESYDSKEETKRTVIKEMGIKKKGGGRGGDK